MKPVVYISLIAILAIGLTTFGLIGFLKKFAPVAEKKEAEVSLFVVEVIEVEGGDVPLELTSEGLVSPRRDTVLTAEVTGRIIFVDARFQVGGTFKVDEVILQLDRVNYEAAVAQAEASVADAQLTVKQEQARGEQAARDWRKIGNGKLASEMVLRVPFLKSARARLVSAEAMLRKAEEDLRRTSIRAPFDCRVSKALLDLGATVVTGTQLGEVYDTDGFEVRLPFSLSDFSELPEDGKVTVSATLGGAEHTWNAKVTRSEGGIDRTTLSAFIIAEVEPNPEAPEGFQTPLPGMFVRAKITGAKLSDVVSVPRSAVRGRDQITVLNADDELEFRTLKIRRSSAEHVFVTGGISAGERVILTKLELPVEGMKLAVAPETDEQP